VQELLAENPQFGIFLTKLITQRLLQNSAFRSNVYMQETGV
jgi:CRP-like cAMP-binding protein